MVSSFFTSQSVPFLLSLSIGILVINILLVLIFVVIGYWAYRSLTLLHRRTHTEEKEVEEQARNLLETAQREAVKAVQDASGKAREILKSAQTIKDDTSRVLTQEITAISEQHQRYLKDASLKYVETYEHMAESAQEEYLNTLHAASQAMANDANQTLGMFEKYLKEQTVGYKEAMEHKIEELRKQANAYVDDYKKSKLKRVDEAINEIILIVAKNVIGRSVDVKEHHELILRALEEAKKEGFFSHMEL